MLPVDLFRFMFRSLVYILYKISYTINPIQTIPQKQNIYNHILCTIELWSNAFADISKMRAIFHIYLEK